MNNIVDYHIKLGNLGLKLLILNLCWLAGVLAGGVLFGLIPATVALIDELNTINNKEISNRRIIVDFKNYYCTNFFKLNVSLFGQIIIILFLWFDQFLLNKYYFTSGDQAISLLIFIMQIITFILFIVASFVQADNITKKQIVYRSLIIILGKPLLSASIIIASIIILSVYYVFPGLLFVFGIALYFYMIHKLFNYFLLKEYQLNKK